MVFQLQLPASTSTFFLYFFLSLFLLSVLYVYTNDAKLQVLPPEVLKISPHRWTEKQIQDTFDRLKDSPKSLLEGEGLLPPKTGRRYVVVGGNGLLGGWIVLHLIQRGEDPRRIRILDVRPPIRQDLRQGKALLVDFVQVDVSDTLATEAAFMKPWPSPSSSSLTHTSNEKVVIEEEEEEDITVFHTVATIRFYERHKVFLPLSEKVNLLGTKNVIEASKKAGASVLVYTSSGSVPVRRTRFWLWPWERRPKFFVQAIDDRTPAPTEHDHFFSNYAVSKYSSERLVREADRSLTGGDGGGLLRTGCLRPGNGIFGPGGDILVAWMLTLKVNMTWIGHIVQNFIYVENCSLAHLCYERRLIEQGGVEGGGGDGGGGEGEKEREGRTDVGGQTFTISDKGEIPTYGDIHRAVVMLSHGETMFLRLSPTLMLGIAHLVEWYCLLRHYLLRPSSSFPSSLFRFLLPPIRGNVVFLQPSMFSLTNVHLLFDDSRARLSAEKGGLGFTGPISTLEGVCKTVVEHYKGDGKGTDRALVTVVESSSSPSSSLRVGFDVGKAEKGVEEVVEKIGGARLVVEATKVWN